MRMSCCPPTKLVCAQVHWIQVRKRTRDLQNTSPQFARLGRIPMTGLQLKFGSIGLLHPECSVVNGVRLAAWIAQVIQIAT